MAGFNNTVDLERAFLCAMTKSVIMARTYLHQANEDLFSSDARKFIFALSREMLRDSNSILTRPMFEYESGARLEPTMSNEFLCEFNMVDGIKHYDSPEAVLSKLKSAETGRQTLSLSESVITLLTKGKIEDAVSLLKRDAMMLGSKNGTDRPTVDLTDIDERLDTIHRKVAHPELFQGLKIGFKTFDDFTGGLFPGELTLLAGVTGLGKSTLCKMIAKGLVTLNGCKNVLHIANEEYLEQVQYKYDSVFTGIPYMDFKRASITDENLDSWKKYMQENMKQQDRGQIFIKEVPAFTDVSLVEQAYRMLENKGIPIHAIIIDHLPHVKPIQQSWGENDERFKAAADCKELARNLRIPVVTPTQAATEVEKKQMSGKRAGKLDVYGSKGQVHVANTFLIITYKGTDDTQQTIPDYLRDVYWTCDVKKNRDGPPFYFTAKHHVQNGNVVEVVDPALKPASDVVQALNDVVDGKLKDASDSSETTPSDKVSLPIMRPGVRDEAMGAMESIEMESIEVNSSDSVENDIDTDVVKKKSWIGAEEIGDIDSILKEAEGIATPKTQKVVNNKNKSVLSQIRGIKLNQSDV